MTVHTSRRPSPSDIAARLAQSIDVRGLLHELLPIIGGDAQLAAKCPFHDDRDPSFSVNASTGRFKCHGCDAHGDLYDLAGHVWGVTGLREQVVAVARWAGATWAINQLSGHDTTPAPVPPPKAQAAVDREPLGERLVRSVWELSKHVTDDAEVSAYLERRGLDPVAIADRDLARALSPRMMLPRWMSHAGVAWNRSGHRLLARLYDANGVPQSLTARRVMERDDAKPKALFPPGPRKGLVLADDAGRWAFRAPHDYVPPELWIAEGLTDFFACSCDFNGPNSEHVPGVLGIVGSASWSQAAADRVPDRVCVVVATDADEAGERYAQEIAASLAPRGVRVDRWRPRTDGAA